MKQTATVETTVLQNIKGENLHYIIIKVGEKKEAINVGEKTFNRIEALNKTEKDGKQDMAKTKL